MHLWDLIWIVAVTLMLVPFLIVGRWLQRKGRDLEKGRKDASR